MLYTNAAADKKKMKWRVVTKSRIVQGNLSILTRALTPVD